MTQSKTIFLTSDQSLTFQAESADIFILPEMAILSEATISRNGQALVLELPDQEIVLENYFAIPHAPLLKSEDGALLSEHLIDSFARNPVYANAGSVNDLSPVGEIQEFTGESRIIRTNGASEKLVLGTPIYEGDIIETSKEGAVNIRFIDDTEFAVSENARLAVDKYVFDPATNEGSNSFSLLRGVFVFTSGLIGRDDPDNVEIETPVGSIGIRGTILAGKIDPAGKDYKITVIEGAIVVRNAHGETTLSNQFETVQLNRYETDISNIGQMNQEQLTENYGALSGVSASLFSFLSIPADRLHEPGGDKEGAIAPEEQSSSVSQEGQQEKTGTVYTGLDNPPYGLMRNTTRAFENKQSGSQSLDRTDDQDSALSTLEIIDDPANFRYALNFSGNINPLIFKTGLMRNGGDEVNLTLDLSSLLDSSGRGFTVNNGTGTGASVSALGDINQDGLADFAFTGTDEKLNIYDSATNTTTSFLLSSAINGDTSRALVSGGGDFNGDGTPDLLIGTPQANTLGINDTGQIGLFNAQTPTINKVITNDAGISVNTGNNIGLDVTGLGDVNSDGYSDYAFSMPGGTSKIYIGAGQSTALSEILGDDDFIAFNATPASDFTLEVESAEDINNDGFADLVHSSGGEIFYLIQGGPALNHLFFDKTVITNMASVNNISRFGEHVAAGGDINRDGMGDLFISSHHNAYGDMAHLLTGGSSSPLAEANFFTTRSGWDITSANILGDINGDGIDDFAIIGSNAKNASNTETTANDVHLVFGRENSLPDMIDLANSFLPGLRMTWHGVGKIEIAPLNDINGDGLDDYAVSAPDTLSGNGESKIMYGQAGPLAVQDGDMRDASELPGNIHASDNGQSLLGSSTDDTFHSLGFHDLSISGGHGNDQIYLNSVGSAHKTIRGGAGTDSLFLTGSFGVLDFTHAGAGAQGMRLSHIEKVDLGTNNTLIFELNDLFQLMQDSYLIHNSRKILQIEGGANSKLKIDDPEYSGTSFNFKNINAGDDLSEFGAKTDEGSFYSYDFADGYQLQISQNLIDTGNVDIV